MELGKGSFGSVSRGVLRGKPVAVKTITPKWESPEQGLFCFFVFSLSYFSFIFKIVLNFILPSVSQVLDDFRNEVAVMR